MRRWEEEHHAMDKYYVGQRSEAWCTMLNADGEGQYLGGTVEAITESEVNATLVALTVRSEYTGKLYELQMDPYLDKCIECWEATND